MVKKITSLILTLAMMMTITSNFTGVFAEAEPKGTVTLKFYEDETLDRTIESVGVNQYVYGALELSGITDVTRISAAIGFDKTMLELVSIGDTPQAVQLGDLQSDGTYKNLVFGSDEISNYGLKLYAEDLGLNATFNPQVPFTLQGGNRGLVAITYASGSSTGADISENKTIAVLKFKTLNKGTTSLSLPCENDEFYTSKCKTGLTVVTTYPDPDDSSQNKQDTYDYRDNEFAQFTADELTIGAGKLATPEVTLADRTLTWNQVTDAASYKVVITAGDNTNTYTVNDTSFVIPDSIYGNLTIEVSACPAAGSETVQSESAKLTAQLQHTLDAPAKVELIVEDGKTVAKWSAVDGATEYTVTLKKSDDSIVKEETVSSTTTEWDVTSYIIAPVQGKETYKVTVVARGDGDLISDSPAAVSNEKSYFGAVGAPTEVKWADDSYTATWSAGQEAENADGYIITLYKGANVVPTELGTIKTTSVDLSAYMTEVGDYTFEVVAVGKSTTEGKYLDSPAAKSTVAKRVAKALEPVEITDWTDRVVTWTDTNANTNKVYEVKLYKGNETTPVLEDTIHETTIDFDDYDENMISEGEYTVEITAKGDNTYYYDSTAVTKTQSFLSRLAKPTGLAWDDTKAVWDDVSSANGYVVSLWFNGVATGIEYSVMNSEYDFASDLQLPGDYTFKVVANATATHTASAEAVSPVKTNDVTRNGNIYIKLYEDAECTIEKTEFAAGDTIYAAITLQSNESTPLEITTLAVPIKFNPAYLQVEAITAGDMLAGFTNAPGYPYYDNEIGLAAIAAYTTEAYTVSAETEEIVAVVTLKATLKSDDLTLTYAAANDQGDPYDEAILSGAEFALADQALFVNENDVVFDVVVGPLPKMETPVWSSSNATLITWEKYDNDELNSVVSGYEIQILKDGVAYGSPIVVEGVDTNNKNLSSYMTTSGSYTVKIRALSNNEEVALDGNEYSDPSAAYTKRSGGGMGSSSTATVTPDDKKDETDKPDTPVTPVKPEFTDIKGHWAEADILELVDLGIVDGYGDNTFRPDLGITRAEFTKLMITCLGLELEEDGYVYDDTKNHWAKNYIALGTKIGIVNGIGDNLFDPDTVITREQIAAIIWRMAGKVEEVGVSQFTDRDEVTEYAKTAVDYVAANGIMIGFEDNTYRGTEKTNRAQMATVVLRLIKANFFENYNK